jgi:hypothetical protein
MNLFIFSSSLSGYRANLGMGMGKGKKGDYPGPSIEDIHPGHFSLDRYSGVEPDGWIIRIESQVIWKIPV